jgi:hypothetical protein
MAQPRIHANPADRQKAYRERVASNRPPSPPVACNKRRQSSRPARLAGYERGLRTLLAEYETWLGRLPEFLEGSEQADRLTEAIEQLAAAADILSDITLPLGFGRD